MNTEKVREYFETKSAILCEEEIQSIKLVLDKIKQYEQSGNKEQAELLKDQGNEAFKSGDLQSALKLYTEAIELDPLNVFLYSNRALVYSKLNMDREGIEDCLKGIKVDPTFIKLYIRAGMLYTKTDKGKAEYYFKKGLEYEPDNKCLLELLESLNEEEKVQEVEQAQNFAGFDKSKIADILKNENVKKMVNDFVKDKSPEELAEMMKNAFGSFK